MMLSPWTETTFRNPFTCWKKNPILVTIPIPSKSWTLGAFVFILQLSLACLTLVDQIKVDFGDIPFNIPSEVTSVVRIGQFITLILATMTQRDVTVSFRVVLFLRYKNNDWRDLINYENDERCLSVWFGRIMTPNLMKSSQGLLVLVNTFIVIIHSNDIVDLLKDFTSLFIISAIDDMFFYVADNGYFGHSLSRETNIVKEKKIVEDDRKISLYLRLFLSLILFTMFGGWVAVVAQQIRFASLRNEYPDCKLDFNVGAGVMGDGKCDFPKNFGSNIPECGWEGGDCKIFNEEYPNCTVQFPYLIGDGVCYGEYNWKDCGFDGGDCLKMNADLRKNYPNCAGKGVYPPLIDDGFCHFNQNTEDCGFDGNDCLELNIEFLEKFSNCNVERSHLVGDKICGAYHNRKECGYDAGDCQNCTVDDFSLLGNGQCDGGEYNTNECGFDGGDCIEMNYPNCNVDNLYFIGDGLCDGLPYNTPECGFDGGDCVEFNEKYPKCKIDLPYKIGDGDCNIKYNSKECGFDAGDCSVLSTLNGLKRNLCTEV